MTTTGSSHSGDDSSQALPFEEGRSSFKSLAANIFYQTRECITASLTLKLSNFVSYVISNSSSTLMLDPFSLNPKPGWVKNAAGATLAHLLLAAPLGCLLAQTYAKCEDNNREQL